MSKNQIVYPCEINEDLEIIPIDKQSYKQSLLSLRNSNKGGRFTISIDKQSKSRSLNQNAYYHGVVIRAFTTANIGYNAEEIHQLLAERFISYERDVKGKSFKFTRSTTSLTTVEMEEYLSNIRTFAGEFFGIFIPKPNEVGF